MLVLSFEFCGSRCYRIDLYANTLIDDQPPSSSCSKFLLVGVLEYRVVHSAMIDVKLTNSYKDIIVEYACALVLKLRRNFT